MNQYVNDFNDTVRTYYEDLKKYKPLTRTKEKRLIKLCKKGNLKAKNEILEANLRFVFDIAKRYTGRGVSISDLISDGNMGLLRAIDKFDETRDLKFISYAVWWIRQAMLEDIKKTRLLNHIEIEPNMSNDTVLEKKLSDDEDEHVSYYEVGFSNENDEKSKETIETQKSVVSDLLENLTDRERDIIELFYGLNNKKELTLTEIAKKYNMSIERIRQINVKSMRKLRSSAMMYDDIEEILS